MQMMDLAGPHIGRRIRYLDREGFLVRVLHEQNQMTYVRVLSPDLLNNTTERVEPRTEVELLPEVEVIEADPDNMLESSPSSDTV